MKLRRLVTVTTTTALLAVGVLALAPPASAGTNQDREDAAMTKLLTYVGSDGGWNSPTGDAWQPALSIDAVVNAYERTGSADYLAVIEKSFERYEGRRSYYFDDDGWYMNAWLRAYDVTGESKYLDEAKSIFKDMADNGWDDTCGGGVWWNEAEGYKNAIPNELFLLGAARLHRRAPNGTGDGSYYDWALKTWKWFKASGMINGSNHVNDGLTSDCKNNGGTTWTYNQGVILGGLVELYRISGDRGYLWEAEKIAEAAIDDLVWEGGILREPCEEAENCDNDQLIFKGIFMQGLARLYNADRANKPGYGTFLRNNADAIWEKNRDDTNGFGLYWKGPVEKVNQATHTAGTLLITEVSLLDSGGETSDGAPYEAENATHTDIMTETKYGGYSGTGYLAGWNQDGTRVTFTITAEAARDSRLTFRYSTGAGVGHRYLAVNGAAHTDKLTFASTGSWSSYTTLTVDIELVEGSNTITLAFDGAKGSSNWINLDRINLT